MLKNRVGILIPAYNEGESIGSVLTGIKEEAGDLIDEIIVIDDNSSDNTFSEAQKFDVKVIRKTVNQGYGAALKTGIYHSSCDVLITIDAY